MASPVQRAVDESREHEKELSSRLSNSQFQYSYIEKCLVQIRTSCSNALLSNFHEAISTEQRAEDRLWDSHQKVNSHFRTALSEMKKSPERKAVEQRKLGQEYLRFIKGSQSFYRGFIERLARRYGGIPALERVAKRVNPDFSGDSQASLVPSLGVELELCCSRTLIHLGDLSRYRETELPGKERNWAPAYGFYDLALTVCPGSGLPFNQRAVIALLDKNIFRAVYNVFRSAAAEDPHPQADMNLRRTLRMIQHASSEGKLVSDHSATVGAGLPNSMIAWYLRLLEMFYHGKESTEKEELEIEVMTQLQVDLIKRPLENPPVKFVLTSIAAQYTAQERFETKPDSAAFQNSYIQFLHINMRIFLTLLHVLLQELEENIENVSSAGGFTEKLAVPLSHPVRRVLPALRLYNLWLENTKTVISSSVARVPQELSTSFWDAYARSLTAMISAFPPQNLPNLEHLLEEDEDTIGFKPLHSDNNADTWFEGGNLRARWHEFSETGRDVSQEMLFRVRGFVVGGLRLTLANEIPVDFNEKRCVFSSQYSRSTAQLLSSLASQTTVSDERTAQEFSQAISPESRKPVPYISNAQDVEAERMVDNIVGHHADRPQPPNQSIESLPELNDPATPPQPALEGNNLGTSSPFPAGTHTVNDIMAAVYKQSQSVSPKAGAPRKAHSQSTSRPPSQIPSPAVPQQPMRFPSYTSDRSAVRVQDHTSRQGSIEHPLLPGLGILPQGDAQTTQQRLSSPQAPRPSRFPPPLNHSRVNSSDSNVPIWGGDIFSPSFQPTDARHASGFNSLSQVDKDAVGEGGAVFATLVPSTFTKDTTNSSPPYRTGKSPWNSEGRVQMRLSDGSRTALGDDRQGTNTSEYTKATDRQMANSLQFLPLTPGGTSTHPQP